MAGDCCNGLCVGAASLGICTERCSVYADCNPPGFANRFACLSVNPQDRLCVGSDYLQACNLADQCLGQVCLSGRGTSGCSWRCTGHADCPAASACGPIAVLVNGSVGVIQACAPIGNSCTVDSSSGLNDCLSGTCLTEDTGNTGYCTTFCSLSAAQPCPGGFTCVEVDPSQPPVCVRSL